MAESQTSLHLERPAAKTAPTPEHATAPEQLVRPAAAEPISPAAPTTVTIQAPIAPRPATPQAMADELVEEIEDILEDDLDEVYATMPPVSQESFKSEGEQTAVAIRGIVGKVHFTAREIFRRIAQWLKLIPGVNVFFLEQEAKIKTDEIVELVSKQRPPQSPKS